MGILTCKLRNETRAQAFGEPGQLLPGSLVAQKQGCVCPVIQPDDEQMVAFSDACPVHELQLAGN